MLINLVLAAIAALTSQVSGRVSAEGASVPGVELRLVAAGEAFDTITNSDGAFIFQGVPVGSAKLSLHLSGYGTATHEVCVRPENAWLIHLPAPLRTCCGTVIASTNASSERAFSGLTMGSDGAPLEGVLVEALDAGSRVAHTFADRNGSFRLNTTVQSHLEFRFSSRQLETMIVGEPCMGDIGTVTLFETCSR